MPIDGSPEMIHQFRKLGKKVIYVTNNSTKTRKEYVEKCSDLGFGGTWVRAFFTQAVLCADVCSSVETRLQIYDFLFILTSVAKILLIIRFT